MSAFTKITSIALVAATLVGANAMTTTAAEARSRNVWPGVAAGVVGGLIIGGALAQQRSYNRNYYNDSRYGYAPRYNYGPSYYYGSRRSTYSDDPRWAQRLPSGPGQTCGREWRYDGAGHPYKVLTCN